jgi:hypothetical protein
MDVRLGAYVPLQVQNLRLSLLSGVGAIVGRCSFHLLVLRPSLGFEAACGIAADYCYRSIQRRIRLSYLAMVFRITVAIGALGLRLLLSAELEQKVYPQKARKSLNRLALGSELFGDGYG